MKKRGGSQNQANQRRLKKKGNLGTGVEDLATIEEEEMNSMFIQ